MRTRSVVLMAMIGVSALFAPGVRDTVTTEESTPAVTVVTPATPAALSTTNVTLPARATFYYPWFPAAWTQQGVFPFTKYLPTLGYYDQTLSDVQTHVAAMRYANIDVGIVSWWGQGSREDKKVPTLLQAAAGTDFRWAFYYEAEGGGDPSSAQIASDLRYLTATYGSSPNVATINGRLVVFVYSADDETCAVADRWATGNAAASAYVVLKVIPNYRSCTHQPDSWHQYGPNVREDQQGRHSFSIAPGFYYATATSPRLARDPTAWDDNVRHMIASGADWQLVISFNEWGEGTAVEEATAWDDANYGTYIEILHQDGQGGVPPISTPSPTPTPTGAGGR